MIGRQDVEFHPVPDEHRSDWAETNFFPFHIPEANISGAVYNVFRPGLGVMMSDVTIFDRVARNWEGLAYVDNQQHIPCPLSLSDYQLRNGVSVKVIEAPRHYRVDYVGIDDTELHFDYHGVMRPQDIADPDQDPMTRLKLAEGGATGWDKAFTGHFDMTARATGELTLRGVQYPINCLSTMDHSWGPRVERDNSNGVAAQAHFDNGLVFHSLAAIDPRKSDAYGPLLHGYVLRGEEVRGLVGGTGIVRRHGMFSYAVELDLTDEDGVRYHLVGSAMNWAPWAPYSSVGYYNGLMRWEHDGLVGYGPYTEFISRTFMSRHRLMD